jgi:hypothetical protein
MAAIRPDTITAMRSAMVITFFEIGRNHQHCRAAIALSPATQ